MNLMVCLQEQLRHKQSINIVAFNSSVTLWKQGLSAVSDPNLQSAWAFIKALEPFGNTNTLEALRAAFADRGNVEGIYLLTDGRPDQVLFHFLNIYLLQCFFIVDLSE